MDFIVKNIGKIALTVFVSLLVFDVIGVVLCFLLDVFDWGSTGEFYALWFVLAVFCGMLGYSTAADMASPKTPENARKAGLLAVFATVVIVGAVSCGLYLIWWRYGIDEISFTPDSEPLTLTFLLTVLASSIFAHTALGSGPPASRTPVKPRNLKKSKPLPVEDTD